MFRTSLLCVFAAAALAQTDSPANFGPGVPAGHQVMGGSGTLRSGVMILFKSVLTPAGGSSGSFGEGGIQVEANTIHRDMVDRGSGSYFGYDLTIAAGDAENGYLATFQPLSSIMGGSLKPMALPKYPAPLVVHDGDVIELDLMVSPDGKQKLTDYIKILSHEPEPAAATTTAEARDFTVDDGPVTFDTLSVTLWINGQKFEGTRGFTGKPGSTFWIGLPGRGRYILSLAPHDGFTKSGAVRDNVLSFQDGGQHYEVRFMSPIAGAGKAWHLYLLHDLTYKPKPDQSDWVKTGTDRLENLLPKN